MAVGMASSAFLSKSPPLLGTVVGWAVKPVALTLLCAAVSVVFFAVPLRFCDAPRLPAFEPAFGSVLLLVRPVPLARWALSRLGVALGLLAASLVADGFAVTSKAVGTGGEIAWDFDCSRR